MRLWIESLIDFNMIGVFRMKREKHDPSHSLNEAAEIYFTKSNEESMEKVVNAAERLIKYFARLYGGGCCEDDLFQAGYIGLIKALKNFDYNKGASFTTYACHCIMGEIRHLVRKEASFYRPGCIAELQYKVDSVIQEYIKVNGEVPPTDYIAEKLKIKEESIIEVMKAGLKSIEEVDLSKIRSSAYESFRLPIEDKLTLYFAFQKLSEIQQKVIRMLFVNDMTQQQVADDLGISQRKVSRMKERSCKVLRFYLEE